MPFCIQASNPATLAPTSAICADFAEAIEDTFPMETEDALLVWNAIPVRLSYKYDMGVIIEDLIVLLSAIMGADAGEHVTTWGSDTFHADWHIRWAGGDMEIDSKWFSVAGDLQGLLNKRAALKLKVDDFLAEWKALLRTILAGVEKHAAKIEQSEYLDALRAIESKLPRYGRLYAHAVTG
jgi:hypothetical protein